MANESPRRKSVVFPDPHLPPQQKTASPPPLNAGTGSHARPRASSKLPTHGIYQPQPIKEAVNSAFDNNKSDMSAQGQADLVAQVTEQVLRTLRLNDSTSSLDAVPSQTPSQGTSTTSVPPRNVYTPPSPDRDDNSNIESTASDYTEHHHMDGMNERPPGLMKPTGHRSAHRDESQSRPPPPERADTGGATTLEKIWQPLFDVDGKPTARLGQFLRGLAIHIIEDYEPCSSLVITPPKMVKFYDDHKTSHEIYPWNDIFGGKMSTSSVSHLYRDLKCQHHFVQRAFDDKPSIPGLTPLGFECWMTHVIRAHPEEEFERFAKAVMEMPISNADNPKERFPKQLSRRLFPMQASTSEREHLEDSILADHNIQLLPRGMGHSSHKDVPPTTRDGLPQRDGPALQREGLQPQSASQPPSAPPGNAQVPAPPPPPPHLHPSSVERERQHYSPSSSEAAVEDGPPPAAPIERERKPYYAQPGGGKVFENDCPRGVKPESAGVPPRTNTQSQGPRPSFDPPEDRAPPRSRRPRTDSQTAGQSGRRNLQRSPSNRYSNLYARSDTDMHAGSYGCSNPTNLHDDAEDGLSRRYSRGGNRSSRYVPEDVQRQFVPPPSQGGHEDDYHRRAAPQSNGHPPPNYNNSEYSAIPQNPAPPYGNTGYGANPHYLPSQGRYA